MGLTDRHQFPFPEASDRPDIPSDIYELANRLDAVITALQLDLDRRLAELEDRVATLAEVRA